MKNICSDVWTCTKTKMLKQCYFKQIYTLKLFIAFKMAYSCCFSLVGNLAFPELLKKSFITSNTESAKMEYEGAGFCKNFFSSVERQKLWPEKLFSKIIIIINSTFKTRFRLTIKKGCSIYIKSANQRFKKHLELGR